MAGRDVQVHADLHIRQLSLGVLDRCGGQRIGAHCRQRVDDAVFDPQNRALIDTICATEVVGSDDEVPGFRVWLDCLRRKVSWYAIWKYVHCAARLKYEIFLKSRT